MKYEFSIESFFWGVLILLAGVAFMLWHQWLADNLGSGVSSYDRFKFWALVTCGVGILVALNLHWFILGNLLTGIFPS